MKRSRGEGTGRAALIDDRCGGSARQEHKGPGRGEPDQTSKPASSYPKQCRASDCPISTQPRPRPLGASEGVLSPPCEEGRARGVVANPEGRGAVPDADSLGTLGGSPSAIGTGARSLRLWRLEVPQR